MGAFLSFPEAGALAVVDPSRRDVDSGCYEVVGAGWGAGESGLEVSSGGDRTAVRGMGDCSCCRIGRWVFTACCYEMARQQHAQMVMEGSGV